MKPIAGRTLDLGVAALAAAQLGAAVALVPRAGEVATPGGGALGVVCPSRALFEVACPFCGMTRSFVALAHGEPGAAFASHPAGPFLAAAMLALVIAAITVAVRRAPPLFTRRRFLTTVEAAVVACLAAGVFHTMRS